MEKEFVVKLNNLNKNFELNDETQKVLKDVNFEIKKGDFFSIIGPSGCGKSTLLRIIAGLEKPTKGRLEIESSVKSAFVFQNFALFPWLTVSENVGFGLKMQEKSPESIKYETFKYISEMGLSGFEEKHPKELSGGTKQRVGLARALAVKPNLLLLDEPFSALDAITANKLRKELISLWKQYNLTIIMVSHLVDEAVELSDKVIVLSKAPGALKEIVSINLSRPRNVRSNDFYALSDKLTGLIEN